MRKLLGPVAAALLLSSGAALAADVGMPTKAHKDLAYPSDSGCYFGINAEAGVAQSNVSANSLFITSLANGNLTASGGSIGGTAGCLKGNAATGWFAVQASINYTNISGSVAVVDAAGNQLGTVGVNSKWSAEQVVKLGGFPALLSGLPNLGIQFPALTPPPIPVPAGYIAMAAKPYVMAGIREFDNSGWLSTDTGRSIGVAPLVGIGMITPLADASSTPVGAVLDTYAKVIFPGRGFSITNLGSNPLLGGAANMGTQYVAGMAVYY